MIELRNIWKSYRLNGVTKTVARDINFTFPTGSSIALMGANGAGKSSLLRLIAGTLQPDRGEIISDGTISFPVGFAGSFHPDLTGGQNVKFVARIYGVDTEEAVHFCRDFAQIGNHFDLPVRTYSSGMRSRLAFAMSMSIKFDTYLMDETTAAGDSSFVAKSEALLMDRLSDSSVIFVSHSIPQMQRICDSGIVLQNGRFFYYRNIERAIEHYQHSMQGRLPPWTGMTRRAGARRQSDTKDD